ncbi:ThiF family adenylyltransferase [Methanobacterium formicicum]|uniref:UBA/THIF-type NAD/FAD binding protein n=1 Tax=Methanobacterium formicicum (strain DSM 3637 / PP1) TaxID=1204725 RepID=K2R234_METFP|nr:ThiF family adenylyltransferase [Methanobacterium formicicum]EKF86588.1 UBA/THIF-type NAD/FAD binding protein [Methanobacterium formicicum DSM 3637]
MQHKKLSPELKEGINSLKFINEVKILQKWQWEPYSSKWFMKICISTNTNNRGKIPDDSLWCIVVEENYPEGLLKIYPDAHSDFKLTFRHQSNNGELAKNNLWRKGNLCIESPLKCLGKYDFYSEPIEAETRLLWNVQRAIAWIHAANDNLLVKNGDPFELPEFKINYPIYCVFSEDEQCFTDWKSLGKKFGIAKLDKYNSEPSVYFIKEFDDENNNLIKTVSWGNYLSHNSDEFNSKKKSKKLFTALWVLLDEIPVVNEWQAPNFYGELFNACNKQNIDLKSLIQKLACNIRDGNDHFLFLGFPIPRVINGADSVIQWQALKLPLLSQKKEKIKRTHESSGRKKSNDASRYTKGSRSNNEKALWNLDRAKFNSEQEIEWLKSQNWNMQEINSRGQLCKDLTRMKTLIIGAGTIGASIAELFSRSGITNIGIMDDDRLEVGNLSRHPLGLMQIGKYKSEEMEAFLNYTNPHIKAEGINEELKCSDEIIEKITGYDLIIDCTGEDSVLRKIEKFRFESDKIFASVSLGVGAKRLYLSLQNSKKFKLFNFREKMAPWIKKEKHELSKYDLPRDGIGCWSSIFPARYDDILLASSTAVKIIEDFVIRKEKEFNGVYKQYTKNGFLIGYIKIE